MYIHNKKREIRLSFTLLQGFAIPHTVEKQPKSTPDMYNPPRPLYRRGVDIYIPTGHSLLLSGLCVNFAKIRSSRKQRQ